MIKPDDKKSSIIEKKRSLRESGEFSDDDVSSKQNCYRAIRNSTKERTKQSKIDANPFEKPTDRKRRLKTDYLNVDSHGDKKTISESLEKAIKKKNVWSGYRKDISWSSKFAEDWWKDKKDVNGRWVCKGNSVNCNVSVPVDTHKDLEIGHHKGFYMKMIDVETQTVCDGENHYDVYLVEDIIEANEDEDNLYPQCTVCNRDSSQRKKDRDGDDPSFGFKPKLLGSCDASEAEECSADCKIDEDGDFIDSEDDLSGKDDSSSDNSSSNED